MCQNQDKQMLTAHQVLPLDPKRGWFPFCMGAIKTVSSKAEYFRDFSLDMNSTSKRVN